MYLHCSSAFWYQYAPDQRLTLPEEIVVTSVCSYIVHIYNLTKFDTSGLHCRCMLIHMGLNFIHYLASFPSVAENNFLLMNFYADWCRFSQQLKPVFDQAADRVRELNIVSLLLGSWESFTVESREGREAKDNTQLARQPD